MQGTAQSGGVRAWAVVVVLALLAVMSFTDRQAVAVMATTIRQDLAITDHELGWLMGPSFFLMFNVALLPSAYAADHWNRKWLIACGVALWSVLTVMSGFSHSFIELLLLRGGVALGEAILAPAALSMIAGMFERSERPFPTGIYVVGSTIGNSGSALFTAAAMQAMASVQLLIPLPTSLSVWRLTLVALGIPGLLLALCLVLLGHEPARAGPPAPAPAGITPGGRASFLRQHGWSFALGFVSLSLFLMSVPSVALWGPTFLLRAFGVSQIESGYMVGGASLIGGCAGALAIPAIIRRYARSHRIDAIWTLLIRTMMLAAAFAITVGFFSSLWPSLACIGGFMFFAGGAATMPTLIVQLFAPQHLCGSLSAVAIFTISLFGYGLAPVLVPLAAGLWPSAPAALGHGIALVALVSALIAVPFFSTTRERFRLIDSALNAYPKTASRRFPKALPRRLPGLRG